MSFFLHSLLVLSHLPTLSYACIPSIPTETMMWSLPSSIRPPTTTTTSTSTSTSVTSTTTPCNYECVDAGWTYHVNGDGTPLCYRLITNTGATCANGQTQCADDGAVVASVHSLADNDFIWDLAGLATGNICIGLVSTGAIAFPYVASNRDKWRWLDSSSYDYQQWQVDQPDNSMAPFPVSGTGCVVIINRYTCTAPTCGQTCNPGGPACGRWNDVSCTRASSLYSICSKAAVCSP